ncbi:MAG: hypothetical protein QNK03_00345 [Myxococcota bacterium]|nr:hypothetical protein [Myxococcota bacterium]
MSLASALERAAEALPAQAEAIRPANGDPARLLSALASDAAPGVLAWLLEAEPAAGEELALAWADLEPGAAALSAVEASALPKAGRKALRRAQHRLRSRGVSVPRAQPRPHKATLPPLEDELARALVSAPDPTGAQLVVVVESHPSGGARVLQGAVDLERGVIDFGVWNANRSQARHLLRDLRARFGATVHEVGREAVAALLARAAEAQPDDRALPIAFVESRARVARPAADATTPGEAARAALGGRAEAGDERRALELVEAGELGPWPPPPDALQAIAERVGERARSRLVVNEEQRRRQVEAALEDAVEERYAPPARERAAARLEESAHGFWQAGREPEARACLAAARAFRERPVRENAVALAMLRRALDPVLQGLREEESSSLLVKP